MSKYSKKVERQIREARRIAESKNKKVEDKNEESRQMKAEKKRVRKGIRKIEEYQKQEEEREQAKIKKRRELRQEYLEALRCNNMKQVNFIKDDMLKFEIYNKLERKQQEEITL